MDVVVYIYWVLIAITIVYPNYIFSKKLKNIKGKPTIHKLLYFLTTFFSLLVIIATVMTILTSKYLSEFLDLKIDHSSYLVRLIYAALVFPLAYLANIYIAKFYLKRISKTKNEIELIGTE